MQVALLCAAPAAATPEQGVAREHVARMTGSDLVEIKFKGWTFAPNGPNVMVSKRITMEPGGHGGWHRHSGPVPLSVIWGEYTLHDASDPKCEPVTLTAGMGWIAKGTGIHLPANQGSEPVVFLVTFMAPAGEPMRIDQPQPEHRPSF